MSSIQTIESSEAPKKIYIIAGEVSGDMMASKIIDALREISGNLTFYGIGGEGVQKRGIVSLFDIKRISLMGFLEIIPHILSIKNLIQSTVDDIKLKNPDIVITIDSPGFCFRVAKLLRNTCPKIKLMHVVAPSVWVYKPGRAKKFATVYDHLLTLLSFEPPFFEKEGLASTYIGHPIFEQEFGGGEAFRKSHGIDKDTKLILVTPGSRRGEIVRHLPIFCEAIEKLSKHYPKFIVCCAIVGHEDIVHSYLKDVSFKYFIANGDERLQAYAAANAALAKSGTNTLEIAASKTPMIVAYKLNTLTYFIIKMLAKVKYASLINIIGKSEIIPEFLQFNCTTDKLYTALKGILDTRAGERQIKDAEEVLRSMGYGSETKPSSVAAKAIMRVI
ncbi:MAG: lipid-A-disaccharide synthase [Pseudomonadota bacterium]